METILEFIESLAEKILYYLPTLFWAIVIFIIGCILNHVVMKLFAKGVEKSKLDRTVHKFLASVIKILITALTLIIVLTVLGIPMTSIITVLGTAGVAVGLALKDSLSNVAGGVILLINRTIKVGDYVQIDSYEGTVDEISILYTKLTTVDNKDIFFPNGLIATSPFINFSSEGKRRVDQIYSISYDNNYKKAIEAIRSVINENKLVLKNEEIFVRLSELASSSLDIKVRVWTKNSDYWTVYYDLLEQIKDKFDEEGISVPYNQLDVHVVENK